MVMICWHLYLIKTHGIANLFIALLVVEFLWIVFYLMAQVLLLKPIKLGYIFLSIFIFSDLAFQIYVDYSAWDEIRLMGHFLSGILLVVLYWQREKFTSKKRYGIIPLILAGLLCIEGVVFSSLIFYYKNLTEAAQWSLIGTPLKTRESTFGVSPEWLGNEKLYGFFLNQIPEEGMKSLNYPSIGGYFDLNSWSFHPLDITGKVKVISEDGKQITHKVFVEQDGTNTNLSIYSFLTGNKKLLIQFTGNRLGSCKR